MEWGIGFDPNFMLKCRRVAKMINIERLGGFWTYFSNPPLLCRYGVGGRFWPLFLFKYRWVAKMINIERLGWVLNVFFKSTLSALVRGGWIVIHLEPRQNTLGRLWWPKLNVFLNLWNHVGRTADFALLWLVVMANFQAWLELWLGLWLTSDRYASLDYKLLPGYAKFN